MYMQVEKCFMDSPTLLQVQLLALLTFLESNQVYVCGRNDTHQLGIPEEEDVLVPKLVPQLSGTSKVALGSRHTLILKSMFA
jgi:alpha-tubulin suppressor-like RCC1 family protein